MIKDLIENKNYTIVLDTNILLDIYKYSPDYSQYMLSCLEAVKDHIILPSTVLLEYNRHKKNFFIKAKKRTEQTIYTLKNDFNSVSTKMIKTCDDLERNHYPEVDILRDEMNTKINEISLFLDSFFEERSSWKLASNFFGEIDYIDELVKEWIKKGNVLESITQQELYQLCDEGEERYKKKIPPGFKDVKNKDGIRKYSDFIIWSETLKLAKKKGNIIFVTNDLKEDWWMKDESGQLIFLEKLKTEFSKTTYELEPFYSTKFFDDIATDYGIEKPQMLELALHVNLQELAEKVSDDVFSKIESSLVFSNTEYIDDSDVGTEGISDYEIEDYEFLDVKESDKYIGEYVFTFSVTMSGTSYDYFGRDEDTKEIYLSPGRFHTFEGNIDVLVSRDVDEYMDFDSFIVEKASIESGYLKQISIEDLSFDDDGESFYNHEELICPDCGSKITEENDDSEYCKNCAQNH